MLSRGNAGNPPDAAAEGPRRRPFPFRRLAKVGIAVAVLLALIALLDIAKNVYVDWLWFDSLGYREVYTTGLFTRLWLFFAGGALFAVAILGNITLATRLARRNEPAVLPPSTIQLIRALSRIVTVLFVFIFTIVFATIAARQWENFLQFTHATPFLDPQGVPLSDPLNHHNPSYYAFSLPLIQFIQSWLLGLVVVVIIGVLGVYTVSFSLRGFRLTFQRGVKAHLSILFGVLAILVAWNYWIDAKQLVLSTRGLGGSLFGANATDVTAKLFALRFMMGVAAAVAVTLAVAAFRKGVLLPIACFVVWLLSALFVLLVYPAIYQRFSVQPNELARETPYIQRNIQWTRYAYGLDKADVFPFSTSDDPPSEAAVKNPGIVDNIRLWDHRPLKDTLNQVQSLRTYYKFLDVDVDRYQVNGATRQVMLSTRELSADDLPPQAHSWVARRLQYTHGYGVAMSPVTDVTADGRPIFFIGDVPPRGAIAVQRPEVYFGEIPDHYVIVNSKTQEFDYPNEQGVPQFTRYAGGGGVPLDSWVRRFAFAWKVGDLNVLISDEVTADSRMLYLRNVQKRIQHIAPFLRLDPDPYMVVAEGRLWWLQDAYTTESRFPYSQRYQGALNYIRNSVKIVVDPYDGAVTFYVADESDAVLRTYARVFPTLFRPLSEMPAALREHLRYPEELFNIQAFLFQTYHVTDPRVFFSREDVWGRPTEVFYGASQSMEAYYVNMPLPGQDKPEFLLLLPFTPARKPNLVAWLAARNDGEHYGKLVAFTFPKDKQVDGPAQVEARINNDPRISQQFTLWGQQGSQVIRGNLLVIPIGKTVLYVEPVYLQASALNFPELRRVIVTIGANSPAMEPTLTRSLDVALGKEPPSPLLGLPGAPGAPSPATPSATPTPSAADLDQLIQELQRLLDRLKQLREQQRK